MFYFVNTFSMFILYFIFDLENQYFRKSHWCVDSSFSAKCSGTGMLCEQAVMLFSLYQHTS